MKNLFLFILSSCLILFSAFSQQSNEAMEPSVSGDGAINLLEGGTLDAWKVPSDLWSLNDGVIVGETAGERLRTPEWLYTKQRFSDFVFTCEMKLSGDDRRNTGVYFRVNTINYRDRFEAASGYEFDAAPGGNYWGSLGDWYARPSLRVYVEQSIRDKAVNAGDWNRMTIRAHGNRLEYWINGIKVMDYIDKDPAGSKEGMIGFQIHDGSAMKIEFRNIRVRSLE